MVSPETNYMFCFILPQKNTRSTSNWPGSGKGSAQLCNIIGYSVALSILAACVIAGFAYAHKRGRLRLLYSVAWWMKCFILNNMP